MFLLVLKADFKEMDNYFISFSIQLSEITDISQHSKLRVFLHPVQLVPPDKNFCCASPFWILTKISAVFERVKNYHSKQRFKWKWILTFCAPGELLWCLATYLVCSFGRKKLHKEDGSLTFASAWIGLGQRKPCLLLSTPAEPQPGITSFLRSSPKNWRQTIKFFSTTKEVNDARRQVWVLQNVHFLFERER